MFHVDPASLAPAPASAGPDGVGAAASPARALIERRIAALSRLAEMGMAIAEAATRAATAAPAPDASTDAPAEAAPFPGDPVLAYTRAARAVRQSFALQSHLLDALAALDKAEAKDAYDRVVRRRKGLARLIGESLQAERPEAAERELRRLADFTHERLLDAEDESDLLDRPFAEVVARICEDLGLSPEATAEVMAGAEGFAATTPTVIPDGPSGPSRDPGAAAAPDPLDPGAPQLRGSGRDDSPQAPEDDEAASDEEDDTFLEWPPPTAHS